ncbi:PH domain-containing protein [Viridibacillus soli]|uniref:PH domain-containing protein n=1 Tax=Viridibacillus soli TaxID=2798301 RepID=UPI003899DE92
MFTGRDYITLVFTVPLAFFMIWGWFKTGYEVKDDLLIIYSGPLKKKVLLKEIKSVKQTKNPLAAYALSLDRLEIVYISDYSMALISPKNWGNFITALKRVNPKIEVVDLQ